MYSKQIILFIDLCSSGIWRLSATLKKPVSFSLEGLSKTSGNFAWVEGLTIQKALVVIVGRDSPVRIATGYWLDESWRRARFFRTFQTGHGAHPASTAMGTGSLPWPKALERGVNQSHISSVEVKERVVIIHDTKSTKCTKLFLIYLYNNITLNIATCFGPQGTNIRGQTKVIPHKTKLAPFVHSWRGMEASNNWSVDIYL